MEKNEMTIKRVIQRCGCDKVLPLCLVYIFYIMLHGHLSPGGGFQGGILTVAVVLLIYLGHGYQTTKKVLIPDTMRTLEGLSLVLYIMLAMFGVLFGTMFCENFILYKGDIGALFSSGTVFLMGETVAFEVVTSATILSIGMLSVLYPQDIDVLKEDNDDKL